MVRINNAYLSLFFSSLMDLNNTFLLISVLFSQFSIIVFAMFTHNKVVFGAVLLLNMCKFFLV